MKVQSHFEDEVSLLDLWREIVAGKWIIVGTTTLVVALAVVASFLMTPIYRAEVLLAVRSEAGGAASRLAGQLGGLASLAGLRLGSSGAERSQAIAMLSSRILTERFIREQQLMPVLFDDLWDAEKKVWLTENPSGPSMRQAVRRFNRLRTVGEDRETGLVSLAIEWKDPLVAATWANKYIDMLNVEMRKQAIAEAEQSISYLEEELKKTNIVELQRSIYSLIEEQIQSIMLANVREEFAFQVLDPAIVPGIDEPIRPRRTLMIALAFVVGLMLSAAVLFFRHVIRSAAQLESERLLVHGEHGSRAARHREEEVS